MLTKKYTQLDTVQCTHVYTCMSSISISSFGCEKNFLSNLFSVRKCNRVFPDDFRFLSPLFFHFRTWLPYVIHVYFSQKSHNFQRISLFFIFFFCFRLLFFCVISLWVIRDISLFRDQGRFAWFTLVQSNHSLIISVFIFQLSPLYIVYEMHS